MLACGQWSGGVHLIKRPANAEVGLCRWPRGSFFCSSIFGLWASPNHLTDEYVRMENSSSPALLRISYLALMLSYLCSKPTVMGWRDHFACKDTCHQDYHLPEFQPQVPRSGRRELTIRSCPLTSTHREALTHTLTHICTHK